MTFIQSLSKALINLKKIKQTELAILSGVHKGNLSIWLQGKRKLSDEAEQNILKALGVVNGQLDETMVHVWTVGRDLSDLNFVLKGLCPQPELQHLMSTELLKKVTHYPLTAIKNRAGIKIIVKQKPTMAESLNSTAKDITVTKSTIDGSKWMIDRQPEPVEAKVYGNWQKGIATIAEFDEFVTSDDIAWTWSDVIDRVHNQDINISPSEVMNAIDILVNNKKK
tara:strand:+ start:3971 stop:4642 length:672 start_codon:yes stop_codon:yes gene_type:complete